MANLWQTVRRAIVALQERDYRNAGGAAARVQTFFLRRRSRPSTREQHLHRSQPKARRFLPAAGRTAAEIRQPPRPDRRRHRHRQDRDPAGHRRGLFRRRRAGLLRRREGRPRRASPGRCGDAQDSLRARRRQLGIDDYAGYAACPAVFWDLFGEKGHPIRATVSRDGPAAAGAPAGAQRDAGRRAQHRLPASPTSRACCCSTSRTCRRCCSHVAEHAGELTTNTATCRQAVGRRDPARAAERSSSRAASSFFGEPALDLDDLMRTDARGRGVVNVLAADKLMQRRASTRRSCCGCCPSCSRSCPRSAIRDKPKLVFFFDEAHLLFDDAPKALLDKVEQVVRLIRSKGVGVYFITQNPLDFPRRCWPSSATACSTRCAPSRPGTEGGAYRGRHVPAQPGFRRRDGDHASSASAKHWSRPWRTRACRRWCSGR